MEAEGRRWKGNVHSHKRRGGRDDVSTPANLVFDTQRLGFFDFCCPEGGGIGSGVEYLEGEVGSGRAGPSGGCQACLRGRCSAVLAPFLFLAVSWDFEALDPPFFRINVIQCLRSLGTARRGSLCWGWAGGLAGWLGTSVAQRGSENGQGGGCCFAATVFFSWD